MHMSLVQGEDGHELNETCGNGEGKGNEGKGEHGGKGEEGGKGEQQHMRMTKSEFEERAEEEVMQPRQDEEDKGMDDTMRRGRRWSARAAGS